VDLKEKKEQNQGKKANKKKKYGKNLLPGKKKQ